MQAEPTEKKGGGGGGEGKQTKRIHFDRVQQKLIINTECSIP